MNASQIAIRTHEEVKLEALRNAIKNAALDLSSSGAREHMFLRLVDDLAAPQINLLLREKVSASEPWGRGAEAKILGLVGDDKDTQFLSVEMLNDLARRALGDVERGGKELMSVSYSRMELGTAFAQFINEPEGRAKKR